MAAPSSRLGCSTDSFPAFSGEYSLASHFSCFWASLEHAIVCLESSKPIGLSSSVFPPATRRWTQQESWVVAFVLGPRSSSTHPCRTTRSSRTCSQWILSGPSCFAPCSGSDNRVERADGAERYFGHVFLVPLVDFDAFGRRDRPSRTLVLLPDWVVTSTRSAEVGMFLRKAHQPIGDHRTCGNCRTSGWSRSGIPDRNILLALVLLGAAGEAVS